MSGLFKRSIVWVLLAVGFLCATNRWLGVRAGSAYVYSDDTRSYFEVARVAPGWPTTPIWHHHVQRFAIHWLIGSFANLTHISIDAAYWAGFAAVWALLCFALVRIIEFYKLPPLVTGILICFFMWNPFVIRYYIITPGMVQDLLFVAGAALFLDGLLRNASIELLAGLIISALGRQTAVMLLPGLVLWTLFISKNWPVALAGILLTIGVYFGTEFWIRSFSKPSTNSSHLLGLLDEIVHRKISMHELLGHFSRTCLPFLVPISMALSLRFFAGVRLTRDVAILLFFVVCVAAQPVLAGVEITGSNAPRLSAMGLIFLAAALASMFARAPTMNWTTVTGAGLIVLLAIGSFHHHFVPFMPARVSVFLGIQTIIALVIPLVIRMAVAHPRPAPVQLAKPTTA